MSGFAPKTSPTIYKKAKKADTMTMDKDPE